MAKYDALLHALREEDAGGGSVTGLTSVTINGQTPSVVNHTQTFDLGLVQAFPASFVTNSTTKAFFDSVLAYSTDTNKIFVGNVALTDGPFADSASVSTPLPVMVRIIGTGKIYAEIYDATSGSAKHWFAMYDNETVITGDQYYKWEVILTTIGSEYKGYGSTGIQNYHGISKEYFDAHAVKIDGSTVTNLYVENNLDINGGTVGQFLQKVNGGSTWATVSIPKICMAACTGMGILRGTSTNTLTWIDPDDIVLNGATLADWVQTVLVVKDGSMPTSYSDGTIIATTSRAAGTKNLYRDSGFVHTVSGGTPYYALFSQASSGEWNALVANQYPSGTSYSWGQVRSIVRAGTAASYWSVGDVFTVDHSEYTHSNSDGIYFTVLGFNQVPAADESLTNTMCLGMSECLFLCPWDNGEVQYALTADLLAITGKVYYTLSGTTYTALVEGTDWNPGDPVPSGSWYEKNIDGRTSGSNNWPNSNIRQWANSSELAGTYTKKTIWDTYSSTLLAKNGFMRNIDSAFLNVVAAAKITTALPNCDGAGYITTNDKFWPLASSQIFGGSEYEGTQLDFYKNGGVKTKHLMDQSTNQNWWMRSPYTGVSLNVYFVTSSGSSTNSIANASFGFSLACIIA